MSIYLAGGLISLGQFAACIAAFGSLQFMAESVVDLFARQKGMADFVGDYYDFFDYGAEEEEGEPYGGLRDGIELRGVSFRYPQGGRDILSDVSFHIRKGERVVIVGENGSGKTTQEIFVGAAEFCPVSVYDAGKYRYQYGLPDP